MKKQEQEPFILVELTNGSTGLLKQTGERKYVLNVWTLPGANGEDNERLIENIKSLYEQYYYRVREYKEDV